MTGAPTRIEIISRLEGKLAEARDAQRAAEAEDLLVITREAMARVEALREAIRIVRGEAA